MHTTLRESLRPDRAATPRGPLTQPPPPRLAARLLALEIDPSEVLLSTPTDIDLRGAPNAHWLIATPDQLLILPEAESGDEECFLPFADAVEFRALAGVGSGILQAKIGAEFIDLLRYSNRRSHTFEKIAAILQRRLLDAFLSIAPEDGVDPLRCPRCETKLTALGESCPRCVRRGAVLLRMLRLMTPHARSAGALLALLLFGVSLDLLAPQLTRYLIDHILPGASISQHALSADPSLFARHARMLLLVVLALAAAQTARSILNIFTGRLSGRIGMNVTHDIRARLVDRLQRVPIAFHDRHQVGSLVGRIAYDTDSLQGYVNQITSGLILQSLLLIGVGAMMFSIDARLAAVALLPAPLLIGGAVVFWRYVYPLNNSAWDASSKQAGLLSGLLSGIRIVKAFGQERRELHRFRTTSGRLRRARLALDAASSTFHPLMGLVWQFGGWLAWWIGGRDALAGRTTLGELMAFFGYLWMFYAALANLPHITNWLIQHATQAHRIFEIFDTPPDVEDSAHTQSLRPIRGDIAFENVSFSYARHAPVLRDLSFDIRAGEFIGIVGRSGCGKSTIVNLLCRFYAPSSGRVTIDGVDVSAIATKDLRSQIGVVLQEPFLFHASIWDNLTYARPDARPAEVIAAAKAANCHDFIMRLAHAYDTWVGERGVGLSGGERQRIALARVLLTDPRILILDEATSSVDAECEAAIQDALAHVVKGRTTIAIAHRLSTLRAADRILVIDDARITEQGTHDELMRASALYARLARSQSHTTPAPVRAPSTGEPPAHEPVWLSPAAARITAGMRGSLRIEIDHPSASIETSVFAVLCAPVRAHNEYISLRRIDASAREVEIGLLRALADWPAEARRLVESSLARRRLIHTVRVIDSIEPIAGCLDFRVQTDLGPRVFTVRCRPESAHDYGPGAKLLTDTDDNRFLVPDVTALSPRERRLFERHIYW